MHIAIDIDEVLTPTVSAFIAFLKDRGITRKFEDFVDTNWRDIVGVTQDEIIDLIYAFYTTEHFKTMTLYPGAKETLLRLAQHHTLHVVSSRQRQLESFTAAWIAKELPGVFANVFVCDNHFDHRTDHPHEKGDVCLQHGISVLVEDDPHHITYAQEKGVSVIVMNRPWNSELNGVERVNQWEEIVKKIEKLNPSSKD